MASCRILIIATNRCYRRTLAMEANLETTFAALLDQLGVYSERPDGTAMPMKIEPWPGGRWYRDLGDGNGHFWGQVRAIKRPTLLEVSGPLFMSYPVSNNVQYRLSETEGGTRIQFRHSALGLIAGEPPTFLRKVQSA